MVVLTETKEAIETRFLASSKSEVIQRLNSEDADIVIMPQEFSFDITALVQAAAIQDKRISISYEMASSRIRESLQEMRLCHEDLLREMVRNIDLFSELFGQKQLEIRLEVTDRQSCPKFHCDNVYARMLVTYCGPTTEFIETSAPDILYHAPLHAIVLLKGHKHPTYQDRILHRSPQFAAGDKRLCMIVNFSDWLPKK